jgi:hypothetical protein
MRAREFLSEAKVNSDKYIDAINTLLKKRGTNLSLQPGTKEFGKGTVVDFYPSPGQQIYTLDDEIKGRINGEMRWVPASYIFKSDAIKNLLSGKEAGTVNINKGELAEGYHAASAFARLIKRPLDNITVDDVLRVIDRLENGKPLVLTEPEMVNTSIADRFELTIKLKPEMWSAFKDRKTAVRMGKIMDSIITDANHETSRFAERFATNEKYDVARVVGDGVSDETTKKTDVSFENEREKKFKGFSIKTLTKQVHQVGGGAVVDSRKSKKATPEERFNTLAHDLFAVNGRFPVANIESIKPQFLKAKSIEKMQQIAYSAATQSLNTNLQSGDREKKFLRSFIGALKYWMGRDDPNIQIKQFTDKGTFILDPNKVDSLIDNKQLDLSATYTEDKRGLPKISIVDTVSNKPLVSIRTYKNAKGYIRNYIEKEILWSELTMIKHIPYQTPVNTAPVSSPIQQQPVQPPGLANKQKPMATSQVPMAQPKSTKPIVPVAPGITNQ